MQNATSEWCRVCDVCTAKKGPAQSNRVLLQLYSLGVPVERLAVDIASPLPLMPCGNQYICVVIGYFVKWPKAYSLPGHEAEIIAGVSE